jgi:hypothetical protein
MQSYDAVQFASIQRSHAYLRKKEYKVRVDRDNRHDLILTLLVLAMVALSVIGLIASVLNL